MAQLEADLEKYCRTLEAAAASDTNALAKLCNAYTQLRRYDDAIERFALLLQRADFVEPREFNKIYLAALRSMQIYPAPLQRRVRLINLVELLRNTVNLQGAIAECGCYLGLSSYVMCTHLKLWQPDFDGSQYHIFDSFEGLSEPTEDDEIPDDWENADALRAMTRKGLFAAPFETVRKNLRDFPRITFHPGWIPVTFNGLVEASYRFVHVDVDLYDPTLDAFNYFYPRLVSGGVIVSDDYNWPGARAAINEFCAHNDLPVQVTEFNQALVRKP